jgi:hypothetical protein
MHPNVSSLLYVSQGEACLTPRRAAKQKKGLQSSAIVRNGRRMNGQQLGSVRHTLAPVRVKPEQVYEDEDTEMVSKTRSNTKNCSLARSL